MSAADTNAPKPATPATPTTPQQDSDWWAEFDAAARRPLATRMRYAFIRTYKPVLDDAPYRSFDSMEQYRAWCRDNLPDWLGFGPARDSS
jgi:hypothetical protein